MSTGLEAREECDGIDFILGRLVLVLKAARISLGAGAAQVVVVAQLVIIPSSFDALQGRLGNLDGRIEPTRSRAPRSLGRGRRAIGCIRRPRLERQCDRRRRANRARNSGIAGMGHGGGRGRRRSRRDDQAAHARSARSCGSSGKCLVRHRYPVHKLLRPEEVLGEIELVDPSGPELSNHGNSLEHGHASSDKLVLQQVV